VVVVVALEVPLALNLQGRAEAELQARALAQAQSFSSALGGDVVAGPALEQAVAEAADQAEGRVTVVDAGGVVVVDSERPEVVGSDYATPGRPEIVAALDRQPNSEIRSSEELGQDILATAVPIVSEGQVRGAVRITQSTDGVSDNVNRTILGLVAIGVAGLAGGLLLAYLLAGSLSRPLQRLADAARRLGSGDLSSRTEGVGGAREVEELARSFDGTGVDPAIVDVARLRELWSEPEPDAHTYLLLQAIWLRNHKSSKKGHLDLRGVVRGPQAA